MIDWTKVKPAEQKAEEAQLATINRLTSAVQAHLDATARERNYDGILSLCTYATSNNSRFSLEGQAGVVWRDAVWAKCYQVMDEALAGSRSVPTEAELIAELPAFSWP